MVAIIENYQTAEGDVVVPEASSIYERPRDDIMEPRRVYGADVR